LRKVAEVRQKKRKEDRREEEARQDSEKKSLKGFCERKEILTPISVTTIIAEVIKERLDCKFRSEQIIF